MDSLRQRLAQETQARRQAEAAVQHGDVQYRTLLEGLPQGVCILQDNRVQFVNRALLRLFGYAQATEVLGQDIRTFFTPHDRQRWEDCQPHLLPAEQGALRWEMQVLQSDMRPIWLETSVSQTRWEDTPACLATFVDVTERRRLQVQLRQAQKSQAIGLLAGGIAHDFNNMLSAILGFTELALRDVSPESATSRRLQRVLRAGERARDLAHQVLTFGHQNEQEYRPVHLGPLVKEVLKLLRASLPATITMHQDCDSATSAVLVDPTHIHQVLINLCAHAEHAMRGSSGTLTIQVDEITVTAMSAVASGQLTPGLYIRLTVRDTGPGMPAEVLEHVFDPPLPSQADNEDVRLGLTVVQGIVHSYHGAIEVHSIPGHGTSFTIYLPCLPPRASHATAVDEPLPSGHEHVLFVDDEDLLVRMGQAMLERLGYTTTVATSSAEALAMFRQEPERFDLVITDQTMPDMTGEELALELRRLRPTLPLIVCTGFSHTMNADKAQALGINAFLLKPVMLRDLALTIRRVLAPE
jgi:PAS domain S-box-containing protein